MPTYGYECDKCKLQFEVVQKITENALKIHDDCGGNLKRLVYPVGIAFKGSGFYVNDYAATKPKPETTTKKESESGATSSAETTTSTTSETKAETTATASTASASKPDSTPKSA